eukprot:CAMPEP_0114531828 /NCGR_PEP_ID=MMETSP0109-20121206/26282_1 /TAXON_ID=29199 /ORGANISM="Chlorarachnion reptans, Strain CCCM449" /LENGTH=614 /DNA_ID=CAMNT_0001714735 /DNA_START=100 /DNA_END=1944 /DNA_ORIENTATION=+
MGCGAGKERQEAVPAEAGGKREGVQEQKEDNQTNHGSNKGTDDVKNDVKKTDCKDVKVMLFSINDVYLTENIPKFRTLVDQMVAEHRPDLHFVTHQGDFLSPSPLSNFDKGLNMVQVMNEVGFSHVLLGNHEFDLNLSELKSRLVLIDKKTKILGTNVRFPNDSNANYCTLKYDITPFEKYGLNVELLKTGGLYGKYEGLEVDDPIESTRNAIAELKKEGVNMIVLLTHLKMKGDRLLAEEAAKHGITFILGGHDHSKYVEKPHGVHLVKSGYDAIEATVTTLTFKRPKTGGAKGEDANAGAADEEDAKAWIRPHDVEIDVVNVSEVATDAKRYSRLLEICEQGNQQLASLGAVLLIPPSPEGEEILSSKDPRNRQCTVGRLLCDIVKKFFRGDVGLISSGKIRNKSDYPKGLSLTDIGAELPFKDNFTYCVNMTAKEIEETLAFSWTKKKGEGGFLTYDNGVKFDEKDSKLLEIGGKPLSEADKEKKFKVVVPISLLNGMDGLLPLSKIGEREKTKEVPLDHLMLLQNIVVKQAVLDQWDTLHVTTCDFQTADADKNGTIERKEFVDYLQKSHPDISKGVIDLFWDNLDEDSSGYLSREQFLHRRLSNYEPQK